jgi:hypothetical protein
MIRMLADVEQATIGPLIRRTIAVGSTVYTDEYDIYARLVSGTTATRRSAMRRASTLGTRTGAGSARGMSTRRKGSGHCCARGCGPTAGSLRRPRCWTWAPSSSCAVCGLVARGRWGP